MCIPGVLVLTVSLCLRKVVLKLPFCARVLVLIVNGVRSFRMSGSMFGISTSH